MDCRHSRRQKRLGLRLVYSIGCEWKFCLRLDANVGSCRSIPYLRYRFAILKAAIVWSSTKNICGQIIRHQDKGLSESR